MSMDSVLLSIRPEWCKKIISGKKTIEVRKTRPKLEMPFKVYIYCTLGQATRKPNGEYIGNPTVPVWIGKPAGGLPGSHLANQSVIGEFVCDHIDTFVRVGSMGFHEEPRYMVRKPDSAYDPIESLLDAACLREVELKAYLNGGLGYGWHISDLKIYDIPKPLYEFTLPCRERRFCESCAMYRQSESRCGNFALWLTRPPQSWCYISTSKENRP